MQTDDIDDDDSDDDAVVLAYQPELAVTAEQLRELKVQLLETLLQHGIAKLYARAEGSGDEGMLQELHCYVEPSPAQFETCETPDGVEDMVESILETTNVNFDNDGGFFELNITAATRECAVEVGWYYTASDSSTATETL